MFLLRLTVHFGLPFASGMQVQLSPEAEHSMQGVVLRSDLALFRLLDLLFFAVVADTVFGSQS